MHDPQFLTSASTLDQLSKTVSAFNVLSEVLDIGGPELLKGSDYAELTECLELLAAAEDIHPADIRPSGVLEALQEITAEHLRWPFAVRRKARLLIESWETTFGCKSLVSDTKQTVRPRSTSRDELDSGEVLKYRRQQRPFVVSAASSQPKALRLLNLQQPLRYNGHTNHAELQSGRPASAFPHPAISPTQSWSLRWASGTFIKSQPELPSDPLHTGSLAFRIGKWWTGPVAAARDGIIKWPLPRLSSKVSFPDPNYKDLEMQAQLHDGSATGQQTLLPEHSPSCVKTSYSMGSQRFSGMNIPKESQHDDRNEISAITYDDSGAYAILLSGELEIGTSQTSKTFSTLIPKILVARVS